MASLLVFGGMLAYDKVKETRSKRRASKSKDFSAQEKQNADRIAALQSKTPFCDKSDWSGSGCGSQEKEQEQVPSYTESQQSHTREGEGGRRRPAPAYESPSSSSSSLVNATANGRNGGPSRQGEEEDETPLVVPD
ncbi:MAG: hypothetical protein Q9183_003572, partial [Haloplaca sp. 2 TL-2023]